MIDWLEYIFIYRRSKGEERERERQTERERMTPLSRVRKTRRKMDAADEQKKGGVPLARAKRATIDTSTTAAAAAGSGSGIARYAWAVSHAEATPRQRMHRMNAMPAGGMMAHAVPAGERARVDYVLPSAAAIAVTGLIGVGTGTAAVAKSSTVAMAVVSTTATLMATAIVAL